jgi:hypothetical protein
MNSFLYSLAVVVVCTMMTLSISPVSAFAPGSVVSRRPSFLSAIAPMPVVPMTQQLVSVTTTAARSETSTMMREVDVGIENYLSTTPSSLADSSTMTLSLQERVAPTAEEVASKKFKFNVLFWGGGIIAPFIATVFYFGPKFWLK